MRESAIIPVCVPYSLVLYDESILITAILLYHLRDKVDEKGLLSLATFV
jgi:hypothetical protein